MHKEKDMKRVFPMIAMVAAIGFCLASTAQAQMGMDIFKRPAIAKAFHPVEGKGAAYANTDKSGKLTNTEIGIVGKDTADGKPGYWMEFVSTGADGKQMVGKVLITIEDFQFHRMIIQVPGQGAMEMPTNMTGARHDKMNESLSEWHSVGTETITVPAGTFSCEHWSNPKNHSEIWTSDKVTPFGMVKESHSDGGQVLVKVLDSFPDRITGPVRQFDMQQMMQQMQQRRQQSPEQ